ncbi:uncharacterized protein LOC117977471 [Pan paniscus]|uniref:uncharacterized protein LOC117977471 n=1 Tax=Pan paniscus TaxID=9597 RepID=UPI0015606F80|nr:uncharacterized protein LOC117977471 [Pan paniscus]
MALVLSDWCPDGDTDTHTGTDPGRTTHRLCAKERGVRGTQPCPRIYLRLPAQNCEETRFCCASPRSVVLGHGAPRTASPPSALSHPSPLEGLSFSPFPPSVPSHPSPPEGLSFSLFHCLCSGKLSESPGCFWNSLGWSFSVLTEPGVWKVGEAIWVAENLAQPLTSPCACYLFFNYLDINSDLKHQFNIQIMLGLQLRQVAFLSRSREASRPSCPRKVKRKGQSYLFFFFFFFFCKIQTFPSFPGLGHLRPSSQAASDRPKSQPTSGELCWIPPNSWNDVTSLALTLRLQVRLSPDPGSQGSRAHGWPPPAQTPAHRPGEGLGAALGGSLFALWVSKAGCAELRLPHT